MQPARVAVVTGSNKGIGFGIIRGLCKQFDGDVYLTARDEGRGHAAVADLEKEGLHPKFHKLDIEDKASIKRLRQFFVDKYGGLDVLVNNAGIFYEYDSPVPLTEQATSQLKINYFALLNVSNTMFPILKSHARVVHMSTLMGHEALNKCSAGLQSKLRACQTVDDISQYMKKFESDVYAGTYKDHGWPNAAYGVTKFGVTLMTPIQQRVIDQDTTRVDVVINACCPGFVNTDLNNHKGHKTIDEGADTPLYLALLPPGVTSPRGQFLSDREIHVI